MCQRPPVAPPWTPMHIGRAPKPNSPFRQSTMVTQCQMTWRLAHPDYHIAPNSFVTLHPSAPDTLSTISWTLSRHPFPCPDAATTIICDRISWSRPMMRSWANRESRTDRNSTFHSRIAKHDRWDRPGHTNRAQWSIWLGSSSKIYMVRRSPTALASERNRDIGIHLCICLDLRWWNETNETNNVIQNRYKKKLNREATHWMQVKSNA